LEAKGFQGAPRFLGIDEKGREILSFIEGEVTVFSPPSGMFDDEALAAAAKLLRCFHDATTDFCSSHPQHWQFQIGAPRSGPVICHNDVGPYNTVYNNGRPTAFIDWDFAAPAPREWDIAYALWRFVPLYADAQCAKLGWPLTPRGPRIRRFLDAYELDDRIDVLNVVKERQESVRLTIESKAADLDPVYVDLLAEGRVIEILGNTSYLEQSRQEWNCFLQ
jgi:hypothetical protein